MPIPVINQALEPSGAGRARTDDDGIVGGCSYGSTRAPACLVFNN